MILFLFCSTSIESYKVFQNNCGAWIGKNSLPPFGDNVPHYTTPNITSKSLASVKYHLCQKVM
jgi:hypothetical protein